MANEINISVFVSGLTMSLQLYSGTAAVGATFGATEIGTTGIYVASVPANTPYGQYLALASAGNMSIASGQLWWDGNYEIPIGQTMLAGLDPNNPMEVTTTTRKAGNINLNISGNGVTDTIVQRV